MEGCWGASKLTLAPVLSDNAGVYAIIAQFVVVSLVAGILSMATPSGTYRFSLWWEECWDCPRAPTKSQS